MKIKQVLILLPGIAIIFILVLISVISGRGKNVCFEEAVEDATDTLYATCQGSYTEGDYTVTKFRVDEVLRGGTTEDTIYVYWNNITFPVYEKNKKYLLVLDRWVNVYFNHDQYTDLYSTSVSPRHEAQLTDEVNRVPYNSKRRKFLGKAYVRSDNLADIAAGSDYILLVRAETEKRNLNSNIDIYNCSVLDTLKGSLKFKYVTVSFFSGTVETGNEYIVLVNGEQLAMQLSSKNSVLSTEKRDEIERIIGDKHEQ